MPNHAFNKPHFFLDSTVTSQNFTTPVGGGGGSVEIPFRDRPQHSGKLRGDLATVSASFDDVKESAVDISLQMGIGVQVEFESYPGIELSVESLANATQGIDLHNVKILSCEDKTKTIATVFIPDGKLSFFEKKLEDYVSYKKNRHGKPLDNQKLIDAIQAIYTASFQSVWSDDDALLPESEEDIVWWEVWLSTPKRSRETASVHEEILADFTSIAMKLGVEVSQYRLRFPEHTIIQVKASKSQLSGSSLLLSRVAEIRAPRVTAELFDSSTPVEQAQWSQDLLDRLKQSNNGNEPYVCILDTGVNVEHPLLAPFAKTTDQLTVTYDRVPVDSHGHGTGMAGLAIWGDLTEVLSGNGEVSVHHKLESVKVIENDGDNKDKPLGLVTSDAVSTAFIANPGRDRVFSMSLSSNTPSDRGRASSWSTALDALAADSFNRGDTPCLFTVCAGNAQFNCFAPSDYPYPEYNQVQGVSDPAQAWNVVTVGAYTSKTTLTESGDHYPLASCGGISPHTTTSLTWDRSNAPVKPEVVFEGGNIGKSELDYRDDLYDLHLLTTHNDFSQRHYQTSYATSAATALAARFTAQVKAHHSGLWPETVRALMIHSADWTDEMFKLISANRNDKSVRKGDMVNLTRMVGFGVPNLDKALWSANNSLSMVVQNEMQPFHKDGSSIKTKDMHLYELPWPKDALLDLGDTEVELTVTLSYFVEPNPSSRNILNKYSYASHQLRFDVKRPLESATDFQKRVNKANRASKTDKPTSTDDSNWRIGSDNRHKGSIHKDIWRGTAAELAERGQIAIYPASGWWKTRTTQNRWESNARYALVVSIAAPEADVDIYTEVDTKIAAMAAAKAVVTA